jgi:hypothetical protein
VQTTEPPIPGVNVLLKGSSVGTVTDIEGNYQIAVPDDGSVLVFSFIGLVTEEVLVGNQSTINMIMSADLQQLEEIIVTAYGETSREAFTGSASVINAEQLMSRNVNITYRRN